MLRYAGLLYPLRMGFDEKKRVIFVLWQGAKTQEYENISSFRNAATGQTGHAISVETYP
jgi:hypothetical protein